ncbi:VOC family protein [Streptomyces wuyuanensis]
MIADLQSVAPDCSDPAQLATFYRSLPGGTVNQQDDRWALGDDWATLHTPSGLVLAFQRAVGHRPPLWPDPSRPQQSHPDLAVVDPDHAQEQVPARGATVLDDGSHGRG